MVSRLGTEKPPIGAWGREDQKPQGTMEPDSSHPRLSHSGRNDIASPQEVRSLCTQALPHWRDGYLLKETNKPSGYVTPVITVLRGKRKPEDHEFKVILTHILSLGHWRCDL